MSQNVNATTAAQGKKMKVRLSNQNPLKRCIVDEYKVLSIVRVLISWKNQSECKLK